MLISELDVKHNRRSFSCGVQVLDSYLKERARKDVERGLCAVHILTEDANSTTIIGFYSLSAFALQLSGLPVEIAKKYPSNLLLPAG